jgi:hypothetical protein
MKEVMKEMTVTRRLILEKASLLETLRRIA